MEEASQGSVRQLATVTSGISADKAKELNKFIKNLGIKGIQSQSQGNQIRVTGKKRDDLQQVIAAVKEENFNIPIDCGNFRD